LDTPFGLSAPFVQLSAQGKTVWFSSRHGEDGLQRSAAFVNHRANMWAARELGATGILSWNGVGAIAAGLSVGQLVVPDDVLDMTRARVGSYTTTAPIPTPQPPPHCDGEGEQDVRRANTGQQTRWAHTYKADMWEIIKPLASEKRKAPTPAEDRLWQKLRNKQINSHKFRRQHPIDRFIVDFFCAEAKLVIEVDGAIHDYTKEEDALRTEFLESLGLRVIRFTNESIFRDLEATLASIRRELTPANEPILKPKNAPLISPPHRNGEGLGTPAPFNPDLRARLIAACAESGGAYATHGTYVCTEGPRLETAGEISMFGWGGAAVVGMTLCPEVWLAAELGIPYASLCIITNMATGRWHLDPRRDFGPSVGVQGLKVTLAAA
jgi:purine nucleoside phosphorylase/very-short-patch-repair endonuclease